MKITFVDPSMTDAVVAEFFSLLHAATQKSRKRALTGARSSGRLSLAGGITTAEAVRLGTRFLLMRIGSVAEASFTVVDDSGDETASNRLPVGARKPVFARAQIRQRR